VGRSTVSEKDGMTMMYIPAGEFLMGTIDESLFYEPPMKLEDYQYWDRDDTSDEYPQHLVYLDAFWMDQTEVTNSMFKLFIEETGYLTDAEKSGGSSVSGYSPLHYSSDGTNWKKPLGPQSGLGGLSNHPVVHVSWSDAKAYCEWAGKRLPTEAEWEKAARGYDSLEYPWGNNLPTYSLANYNFSTIHSSGVQTAPVGSYPEGKSPFGVLDMAGNVREWVADLYVSNFYGSSPYKNPLAQDGSDGFLARGGSWADSALFLRSASRLVNFYSSASTGFRCVKDAE